MDRLLVCSDIHGCYDRFVELLDKCRYDPTRDQLLILGDYIDRGPKSRDVVRRVIELQRDGAICLRGNHEDMCIDAMRPSAQVYGSSWEMQIWLQNGGSSTLASYEREGDYAEIDLHVQWFRSLPLYHETEHYIFTHAHPKPGVPMHEQSYQDLIWGRHNDRIGLGKWNVHGHTPVLEGLRFVEDQLWIDTGAVFGGKLTMVQLPIDGWNSDDELKIWQT